MVDITRDREHSRQESQPFLTEPQERIAMLIPLRGSGGSFCFGKGPYLRWSHWVPWEPQGTRYSTKLQPPYRASIIHFQRLTGGRRVPCADSRISQQYSRDLSLALSTSHAGRHRSDRCHSTGVAHAVAIKTRVGLTSGQTFGGRQGLHPGGAFRGGAGRARQPRLQVRTISLHSLRARGAGAAQPVSGRHLAFVQGIRLGWRWDTDQFLVSCAGRCGVMEAGGRGTT